MGKILLIWTYDSDLLECPDYISDDLQRYVKEFDEWIYNKDNDHNFWTKDCEDNDALCFGSEAFVDWLNSSVIPCNEKKVNFLKRNIQPSDDELKLPHIYF